MNRGGLTSQTARLLLASCGWLVGGGQLPASNFELSLDLAGRHAFSLGDDPAWADPAFDDSNWQSIRVPGGWLSQGWPRTPYIGWYRIHFDLPSPDTTEPIHCEDRGFLVGAVFIAYEVYLNGHRIAQSGEIDEYRMWGRRLLPHVSRLPREHLAADGHNVLAIRVQRIVADGGIVEGPVGIGNLAQLSADVHSFTTPIVIAEALFVGFYASTFGFSMLLYYLGFRGAGQVWFAVVILQICVSHCLYSYSIELLGLKNYPLVVFTTLLDQFFPLSTYLFFRSILHIRLGGVGKLFLATYVVCCAAWWINAFTKDNLYWWWILLATVFLGPIAIGFCAQRAREGNLDAKPLLWGLLGLVGIHLFLLTFSRLLPNANALLVPFDWYAWLCLHFSMIYTLAAGYQRTRRRLQQTSQAILVAHEEERKRLARELHDGLGQSMAAVKLKLEMHGNRVGRQFPAESDSVREIIADTAGVVDELHRVSVDLRPDVLEQTGLVESIRQLANRIQQTSSTNIRVVAEDTTTEFRTQHNDHVYRIVQEALANVVRHANASEATVSFTRRSNRGLIVIQDDGRGFEADKLNGHGLGLTSMAERAKLLDGRLSVASNSKQGTKISLEVTLL